MIAFGRGLVGGQVGSQPDLSQRADWFWPARDLACLGERDSNGRFQINSAGEAKEPSQTFTRHQDKIVTLPFREAACEGCKWPFSGSNRSNGGKALWPGRLNSGSLSNHQ
jgi:hypothetical protein